MTRALAWTCFYRARSAGVTERVHAARENQLTGQTWLTALTTIRYPFQ
jgi:hypothetical protein